MNKRVAALRDALVKVLSIGTWDQIEEDHRRVELGWRPEFDPGWGKPKYVDRVMQDLDAAEVLAVSMRALNTFNDRSLTHLEDAVWWVQADGEIALSSITRQAVAVVFDGYRLHPRLGPEDFINQFAVRDSECATRFQYSEGHQLLAQEIDVFGMLRGVPTHTRLASHLELLEAYGLTQWPDRRLRVVLENLVHPEVRVGEEQETLVSALNSVLRVDGWRLEEVERLSGHPVFEARQARPGVSGRPKNLIFASNGPKPELGFSDAVNNDVVILRNGEHCLVYDEPISSDGLLWSELTEWWGKTTGRGVAEGARQHLGKRLLTATGSPPERRFFEAYFQCFTTRLQESLPALIPQVYLHYDPVTLRQLRARNEAQRFPVQRMDFLILLPDRVRVVLEVDGKQHYANGMQTGAEASPRIYADTISADRKLRLMGYEVYRFGGYELRNPSVAKRTVEEFFSELFPRRGVKLP